MNNPTSRGDTSALPMAEPLSVLPSLASIANALPPLPCALDALEPFITRPLLEAHYNIHASFVAALDSPLRPDMTMVDAITWRLEWIHKRLLNLRTATNHSGGARMLAARLCMIRDLVRHHGGGHVNHSLFWRWLTPHHAAQQAPDGVLEAGLKTWLGSFQKFKDDFTAKALSVEGDGWTWLVLRADQSLAITSTQAEDNPLMRMVVPEEQRGIPLFGVDVAEHAYAPQYGPNKARYLDAWWQVVNWNQVSVDYSTAIHDPSLLAEPPHDPLWGWNPASQPPAKSSS